MADPCFAQRKKKVLVLHSYHQGLEWTDNITRGIQDVFEPLQHHYEVYFEYLDTKRHAAPEYINQVATFIESKNSQIQYEAILLSDNNALKLLNDKRIKFRGNPPIIFCGINNFTPELITNIDKVTGVVETTDHLATIELMHKLHPDHQDIVIIVDRTSTGDRITEEINQLVHHFEGIYHFKILRDFSLEEVPKILATLNKKDLIYILSFNRDRENNFISYREGMEFIAKSTNIPIYGSWDFFLGKGIIGGSITSGYIQGFTAAEQALQILNEKPIEDVPIITESPTSYMFDYNQLQKFEISTASLPKNSLIINQPPNLFEQYKTLLLIITSSACLLALFFFYKYSRQQSLLQAKHAENLEKTVKKRTLELEESNIKLQQLSNLDDLSQLYNRRYFDLSLRKELNRHHRFETALTLLICDIDFFKNYNDTYGHLAGDDCLRAVSQTIRQHCQRESDIVSRYGGEEFGIILPNTGAKEAASIAENIRNAIESLHIKHQSSSIKDCVTISIGGTIIIPDQNTRAETIIALADKALYQSKSAGRNQVTLIVEQDQPQN
jgi:diguanylate cyclase (GGDEF)-like protein